MVTPENHPPREKPKGNGCLWGCLAVILIVALPMVVAAGYGSWFVYEGFRHDPVLRAVSELVRHDGMAEIALGRDIRVTGVEGNAFSFVSGLGSHSAYDVALTGSRGDGTLAVEAETERGHVKLESMILTGPDGSRYDLLHHVAAPAAAPLNSI